MARFSLELTFRWPVPLGVGLQNYQGPAPERRALARKRPESGRLPDLERREAELLATLVEQIALTGE